MIKCKRPEWLKCCIFRDVIVHGEKRRYYMESVSSSKRYFVHKRQWYYELIEEND